jgi:hypothetical protein
MSILCLGAAIIVDGRKIGSLCAIDIEPRTEFSLNMKMDMLDISYMVSAVVNRRKKATADIVNSRAASVVDLVSDLRAPLVAMKESIEALELDPIISQSTEEIKEAVSLANAYLRSVGTDIEANLALAPIILRKKDKESALTSDLSTEECDIFDIISRAKEVISTVSYGNNVQWHVDETHLSIGSHRTHADVILYTIVSAINRLVREWASIDVFIGFRKNLWSIDNLHGEAINDQEVILGKLCVEVHANGRMKIEVSHGSSSPRSSNRLDSSRELLLSSTIASIGLLNDYYSVDSVIRDIGGTSKYLELKELDDSRKTYLMEYEYSNFKKERSSQPERTGLSLLLQSNAQDYASHGSDSTNILCSYTIPCQINKLKPRNQFSSKRSAGLEVLIISPDVENANIRKLVDWIQSLGITLFATDRGNEAIDKLLSGLYQVAIIDLFSVSYLMPDYLRTCVKVCV